MSAANYLSQRQFMSTSDLAKMASDEFEGLRGKDLPGALSGEYLDKLTNSVRRYGVKTPIDIGDSIQGERYLLNGHHRAAAAIRAGLHKVPVVVHSPVGDEEEGFNYPTYNSASNDTTPYWLGLRRRLKGDV